MTDRSSDMRHILSQINNIWTTAPLFEAQSSYFYHGTSSKLVPTIAQFGLTPRATTPKSGPSRNGFYLTDDIHRAADYAYLSTDLSGPGQGGKEVVLRVSSRHISKHLLGPDDYDLYDILNGGETGDEDVPHDALAYAGDWQKVDWQTSLRLTHQVLYTGLILPGAIEWMNHDENRWETIRTYRAMAPHLKENDQGERTYFGGWKPSDGIDSYVVRQFLEGGCGYLASAIAEQTDWPIMMETNGDDGGHVWVVNTENRAVDIQGTHPSAYATYPDCPRGNRRRVEEVSLSNELGMCWNDKLLNLARAIVRFNPTHFGITDGALG